MKAVVRSGVDGALWCLGLMMGLCVAVGGCSSERGEASNGVVLAAEPQPAQLVDGAVAESAPRASRPVQSSPATQDEDNLDPFGSLPIGIGFDTYTTECDPIADPYATCL